MRRMRIVVEESCPVCDALLEPDPVERACRLLLAARALLQSVDPEATLEEAIGYLDSPEGKRLTESETAA